MLSGIFALCIITMIGYQTISGDSKSVVPHWIKNNAKWWADGSISDSEFLSGIKYLIEKQIILLDSDVKIPAIQIITEKTKYHIGEQIIIKVKNIGTEKITFPGNPPFGIKNLQNESICCSGTEGLLSISPNMNSTYTWNQLNFVTSKQAEKGKYKIYTTFNVERYPTNIYEVSKWIEIID